MSGNIEPTGVPPGVPASMITPTGNMPAIGVPNTQDYARLIYAAPYFTTVPIAEIIQPSVTEAVENALPSLIPPYVDQAVLTGVQQYSVLLTGSTMSGPLFLSPLMPTADSQAATKAYVDALIATAGIPEVPPVPQGQIWGRETGQWTPISQSEGTFLPLSGGTMGGSINMSGNTITNMAAVPAMPNGAAPAQWVLNQIASVSLFQGQWDADTNVPDLTQLSVRVNGYTWIAVTTSPSGVVVGPAIPGLQGKTIFNGDTIYYSTVDGAFFSIHAGGLTLPEAQSLFVLLAGSQMSGALLLNANASQAMQAVPFQQLEAAVANTVTPDAPADGQAYLRVGVGTNRWVPGLPLAGGILTGALTLAGNATTALMPVPLQQMTSAITAGTAGLLPIAGGTMTGPIVLAGNAAANLNPVPLQQLNSMLATYATQAFVTGGFLPLAGGTISGSLGIGATPPVGAQNALVMGGVVGAITAGNVAGNAYFDGTNWRSIASGQTWLVSANAASSGWTWLFGGTAGGAGVIANFNTQCMMLDGAGDLTVSGPLLAGALTTQQPGIVYNGLSGQMIGINEGSGNLNVYVSGGFAGFVALTSSDRRLKSNIVPAGDALGTLMELPVHSFDMRQPMQGDRVEHWDCGLIADEVETLIPRGYIKAPVAEGFDTVAPLPLIATLVRAVQQLAQRVSVLEVARA